MTKIAVFVGSLRKDSINRMLARNLEKLAPEGVEFAYADIDLPLYNQDLESDYPQKATALKQLVESADGVLIVTPEYNRSFPGVLKNAIDWASRPWGSNSFNNKPVGLVGTSAGPLGAAQAQSHLRNVLYFLNTKLLGQPEMYVNSSTTFDENGDVVEASREYLTRYIETFVAHVKANQ